MCVCVWRVCFIWVLMGVVSWLQWKMMNSKLRKKCSGPFSVWPLEACEVEEWKQVGVVVQRRGVELMQLEKQNTGAQV